MTDVLVNVNHVPHSSSTPTRSRKQTNASARAQSATRRPTASTQPENAKAALVALSRVFKGANNLVHSLLDGLTGPERQHKRKLEERRQILVLRMQNVSQPLSVSLRRALGRIIAPTRYDLSWLECPS